MRALSSALSLGLGASAWAAVAAVSERGEQDAALVSPAGNTTQIKGWNMQSSEHASKDMSALSMPGADVSSWYRVGSYATVMVRRQP
jgi:exo-1,4-beta-D-glucosaminidase